MMKSAPVRTPRRINARRNLGNTPEQRPMKLLSPTIAVELPAVLPRQLTQGYPPGVTLWHHMQHPSLSTQGLHISGLVDKVTVM